MYVNGLQWHEVERLVDSGPADRVYVTETDDENNVTVRFGDGIHGMRPPTGMNNVTAKYSTGLGTAGNVLASRSANLLTRPLGVKGVRNPLPASGGEDRDQEAMIRWNVPLSVTALGRLVSAPGLRRLRPRLCRDRQGSGGSRQGRDGLRRLTIAGDDEKVHIGEDADSVQQPGRSPETVWRTSMPTGLQVGVLERIILSLRATSACEGSTSGRR